MTSPLQRVWSQGRVYGLGNILNRVAGLLLIPILLHTLSTEAWGAYALILVIGQVLLTVPAALIDAMMRLYFDEGPQESTSAGGAETANRGDKVVATMLAVYLAVAVLFAVLAYPLAVVIGGLIFGHQDYLNALLIANVALIFEILFEIELGYFRMRMAANLYIAATLVRSLVQFALSILFVVVLQMAVTGLLLGHLISVALLAVPVVFWIAKRTGWRGSGEVGRELFRIGLPLLPANLAKALLDLVGRAMLNVLASTSAVGIFALASKLAEQIHLLLGGPFTNVWSVQLLELSSQPERAREINRVMVYFVLLLMILVLALALYAPEVVMLLSARDYWSAAAILPLLAFGYVARIFYTHFETCIIQGKRTLPLPLLNWITVGVAVAAFYLLIPRFGLLGAALADVAARSFRVVLSAWIAASRSDYARYFPWVPVSSLIALAVVFQWAGALLIGPEVTVIGFLLKGMLVALYALCGFFSPVLKGDERRHFGHWIGQRAGPWVALASRRLRG